MGGIDFRGRRRLRDRDTTERLSALLREDRGEQGPPGAPATGAGAGEGPGLDETAVDPGHAPGGEHGEDLGWPGPPGRWEPEAPSSSGSRHREDVRVRRVMSRPALVLLCGALLVALAAGAAALLGGSGDDGRVVVSAEASPGEDTGDAALPQAAGGAGPPSGAPWSAATAGQSTGAAGAAAGVVTVHVVGEVKEPSVVTLSPGARVMDAVEAAGGFTSAAVKDQINLAEPVTDGAQITIPNARTAKEAAAARPSAGAGAPAGAGNAGGGPDTAGGASTGSGAPVNLNTASAAELEELPRVGPVLSQRIVEFRTQHGPFTAPEQLDDVSGVGPVMLEALLPLVTV